MKQLSRIISICLITVMLGQHPRALGMWGAGMAASSMASAMQSATFAGQLAQAFAQIGQAFNAMMESYLSACESMMPINPGAARSLCIAGTMAGVSAMTAFTQSGKSGGQQDSSNQTAQGLGNNHRELTAGNGGLNGNLSGSAPYVTKDSNGNGQFDPSEYTNSITDLSGVMATLDKASSKGGAGITGDQVLSDISSGQNPFAQANIPGMKDLGVPTNVKEASAHIENFNKQVDQYLKDSGLTADQIESIQSKVQSQSGEYLSQASQIAGVDFVSESGSAKNKSGSGASGSSDFLSEGSSSSATSGALAEKSANDSLLSKFNFQKIFGKNDKKEEVPGWSNGRIAQASSAMKLLPSPRGPSSSGWYAPRLFQMVADRYEKTPLSESIR